MLSVVEVSVDYGVNVFQVCLDFSVVYGVAGCVNVCVVIYVCFLCRGVVCFLSRGVVCCVVM